MMMTMVKTHSRRIGRILWIFFSGGGIRAIRRQNDLSGSELYPQWYPRRYSRLSALSPREREVFELLLRGMRNREIEERLYISLSTVKNHVYSIFRKLRVHSRMELMARYMDPGVFFTGNRITGD